MEYHYTTPLKGRIAMTSHFHEDKDLQRDKTLYKFIWVLRGSVKVEIDHVETIIGVNEIISLTPLHLISIVKVEGEYLTVLFNSNFYCIFGHDNEVSCNGLLFHGSSDVMKLQLDVTQIAQLQIIVNQFQDEYRVKDNLQEEMLRITLKHFIITCTRIARFRFHVSEDNERSFELIRKFYVLVDQNFREKKQVKYYADLLHRSPKTITNLFASYELPSPLRIIRERVEAEAKRLLIHTNKSAKEIGEILGFEDQATFSRFFKKMTGESIFDYRKKGKINERP